MAMAEDGHDRGAHATPLPNSNIWMDKQGATEAKKNRRIAQQSSRKKGFPPGSQQNYSTPMEHKSRKNNDPFCKTPGQQQRRDLMADTKIGALKSNIN